MSFHNNAIFWIEVEKIKPNPFQPRRDFDEVKLRELAESIRQYGVLQPLVVTRREVEKPDGGLMAEYELIAGERRLRASKIAGVASVPALIKDNADDDRIKLELAIIENLQREDISAIDRARAFAQLAEKFNMTHDSIAKKVGKSRVYVTNTIRLLNLPEDMQIALSEGKISEGHTRPLLMLVERPEEQITLFKEIIYKRLTVRDAEQISRSIAKERSLKKGITLSPELAAMEEETAKQLGTRIHIEPRDVGGRVHIEFTSEEDLRKILYLLNGMMEKEASIESNNASENDISSTNEPEEPSDDSDLYAITHFSL